MNEGKGHPVVQVAASKSSLALFQRLLLFAKFRHWQRAPWNVGDQTGRHVAECVPLGAVAEKAIAVQMHLQRP